MMKIRWLALLAPFSMQAAASDDETMVVEHMHYAEGVMQYGWTLSATQPTLMARAVLHMPSTHSVLVGGEIRFGIHGEAALQNTALYGGTLLVDRPRAKLAFLSGLETHDQVYDPDDYGDLWLPIELTGVAHHGDQLAIQTTLGVSTQLLSTIPNEQGFAMSPSVSVALIAGQRAGPAIVGPRAEVSWTHIRGDDIFSVGVGLGM